MVHRNLTRKTILVRHDNLPILTGFDRTKIPSDISVASPGPPVGDWDSATAPEVRQKGLGSADRRSDVYSLCVCLTSLFPARGDSVGGRAVDRLSQGLAEDPEARTTLGELEMFLSELLGDSVRAPRLLLPGSGPRIRWFVSAIATIESSLVLVLVGSGPRSKWSRSID